MGTLRTTDSGIRSDAMKKMDEVLEGVTKGFGAKHTIIWEEGGYDVTFNSEEAFSVTEKVLEQVLPGSKYIHHMVHPLKGGEDFSAFAKCCPGNFVGIGCYNEALNCTAANHNAKFKVDEESFKVGVKVHYGHIHELLMK